MSRRFRRILILLAMPVASNAQTVVRVTGVTWDSLSGRVLGSALVSLGTRTTISDSLGRFSIDSVTPGSYRLSMQHDAIDSLGLSAVSASIVVRGGDDAIRIAIPSSRTMWRRACPGEQPRDSGFVFGVVRDEARKPIAGARIVANWIELQSVGRSVVRKAWRLEVKTTADGAYLMCGMPLGAGTSLHTGDSSSYAGIEVFLTDKFSVQWQDLTITNLRDSTARGTIRGIVTSDGAPVGNVHVETDGLPEVITANDGSFVLRGVATGTRQVYVQGIGLSPTSRIVEVTAGDTTRLVITVGRAVLLDAVRVTAATARTRLADQFRDRQRVGIGYFRDSLQLGKYLTLEGAFATMPSVRTERPGGGALLITIGGSRPAGSR